MKYTTLNQMGNHTTIFPMNQKNIHQLTTKTEEETNPQDSDAFNSTLTSGMELLHFNIELDSNLTNKIVTEHIPYNQWSVDNSLTNSDFSDNQSNENNP